LVKFETQQWLQYKFSRKPSTLMA